MFALAAAQSFYELAAQIIPVLLLVLFLGEGRVIRATGRSPDQWRSTALLGLGAIFVMLLGEMAALSTVARGEDTYFLHGSTVIALVYGFTFVFAQAAKLLLLPREGVLPPAHEAALGRFYALLVVIVLFVSYEILAPGFLPF